MQARELTRAPDLARPPAPMDPPSASAAAMLPAVRADGSARTMGLAHREPAAALPRISRTRISLRAVSFVAVVLLPIAIAAGYYFGVAADQYVAEFRFTLSTVDPPRLDPLSLFAGNSVQSPAALESQILVQYIASRAIVDDIGASLDLRRLFAPPQADWWSRLRQPASIEALVHYWQEQVDPFYDPATGTVTVRVRAFAPADALRLAEAIGAACEKLVNDLSARARRDALQRAEAELARAESRLAAVLGEIRAFRDREELIDPAKAAEADNLLATRLHEEVISANAKLATLKTYMADDAPSVKLLMTRVRSLEAQQRLLAQQTTGPDKRPSTPLSAILGSYEQLLSKQKFAEASYQLALRGVDEARANADRQHVFVASFVPPSRPEEPLYPRRWRSLGIVALIAFAVWGIGGLAAQSVRDHLW